MAHRKDTLAAAAEWMVQVEKHHPTARRQSGCHGGGVTLPPGAVNVIPGEVALSLDIRGPQDARWTHCSLHCLFRRKRSQPWAWAQFQRRGSLLDRRYALRQTAIAVRRP